MKVKVERECCQILDLKYYNGILPESEGGYIRSTGEVISFLHNKLRFCKYCGQLWGTAAGAYDGVETPTILVKVFPSQNFEGAYEG